MSTLRHSDEQKAQSHEALTLIANEEPLLSDHLDALSALAGTDLETFCATWKLLSSGARERLLRSLCQAANNRLRLDFSAINHLGLVDADPAVRRAAVQSALEDSSESLLGHLIRLLSEDPDGAVREAAIEDLSRFALLAELHALDEQVGAQVRRILLDLLNDEAIDQGIRSAALAGIGYFSDPAASQILVDQFSNPTLRVGAIRGMGRSADPRWTERLMPVLGSDDPEQREQAARALGEIQDERAAGPLAEVIDDEDREVRFAVISALGEIGGEEAREALIYLMEEPDEGIHAAAEAALSALEEGETDPLDL